MENITYQQILPSCTLNCELLAGLEKRLLLGIPTLLQRGLQTILKGLGLDSHKKLESYKVVIDAGRKTRTLGCSRDLQNSYFDSGTSQVRLLYSFGGPKIIVVEIIFPKDDLPRLILTTQSPQVEKLLPKIADGLCAVIDMYGNRYNLLHNRLVQSAILISLPTSVMLYGLYLGVDILLLYTSMGWLCLFSLGMTMSLPHLFPWVTFESRRRFHLSRLPLLAKFSLLTVAAGCYVGLILTIIPVAT